MPLLSQPGSNPDATYPELAKFAGRIAALLKLPKVQSDPDIFGCLDDFLGAIYALQFAKQRGFKGRAGIRIEPDKVVKRADELAGGTVRTDGNWMAGFHFNSALFRMAAVYHRALKVAVDRPKTEKHAPALCREAQARYSKWKSGNIQKVHTEVNHLKHTSKGVYHGRTVGYYKAVLAVAEVLDLVEAWARRP